MLSLHSKELEKALKERGAKLIYLSPYSPDFSPSENLWSPLKNILRSLKTPNYKELAKAREFAFNEVTERKYLELAPVTAVIVPHLFDKGYSSLLGSGNSSRPGTNYKKVVTEFQNSIGLFLPNETQGLSLTFNPL